MTDSSNQASAGWVGPRDTNHPYNTHHFWTRQHLSKLRTNVLVKIIAVHAGSYPHSYTVDVQPLVNQVDGAGNKQEHGTVYGIPMLSSSGGNGAVIVKPKVGDMGMMAIGDRDGSAAIAANGLANPDSGRMHSMSDGVYLGGFGNQNNSSHYIVADENGFTIHGDLNVTGKITASGEVKGNNVQLSTHTHGGVTVGSGHTAAPDSGT